MTAFSSIPWRLVVVVSSMSCFFSFSRLWHSDRHFSLGHSFSRSSAGRAPKRRTFWPRRFIERRAARSTISRQFTLERNAADSVRSLLLTITFHLHRNLVPSSFPTFLSFILPFLIFSPFYFSPEGEPAARGCRAFAPPTFPARRSACIKGT